MSHGRSEAKIKFIGGERDSQSVDVPVPGCFIGREMDNDIRFDVDKVSRYHAKIEYRDDGNWHIKDLGSSNGTFVNGQKVAEDSLLRSGDMISVGDNRMLFRETRIEEPGPTMTSDFAIPPEILMEVVAQKKPEAPPADHAKADDVVRERVARQINEILKKLREDRIKTLRRTISVAFILINVFLFGLVALFFTGNPWLKNCIDSLIRLLGLMSKYMSQG